MDIRFQRPDGKETGGYLAMPKDGEKSPSVVLVPEWWGVNEQIKKTANRLAEEGFRVLVIDPFNGKVAKNADEAGEMMAGLDMRDTVEQIVRGAVKHLEERTPGSRCAVMGFCMGGAIALASAVHVRELDAAVCFYGIPPKEVADPRNVRIPFQAHFAKKDDWCTPQKVDELEREMRAGGVNAEVFHYDAQHAFMNDKRPEVYDPVHAKQAWDRALQFLERTIGGHAAMGAPAS